MHVAGTTSLANQRMDHDRDRTYTRLVCGASMVAIPWWGEIVSDRGMFREAKAPYFEAR